MRRSKLRAVLGIAALSLVAVACEEDGNPPTPTPTPAPTVERFSGSLSVNGGVSFPFSTTAAGQVSLTLSSTAPETAAIVGISIGAWNVASSSCSVSTGVFNDTAQAGITVSGQVAGGGFNNVCARVYDSGKLTGAITFEITVVRP